MIPSLPYNQKESLHIIYLHLDNNGSDNTLDVRELGVGGNDGRWKFTQIVASEVNDTSMTGVGAIYAANLEKCRILTTF